MEEWIKIYLGHKELIPVFFVGSAVGFVVNFKGASSDLFRAGAIAGAATFGVIAAALWALALASGFV